ncbi:MAG: MATE family efflux transporter [Lewinellaceae bacterium]|nr:MATE family efflux transporter [Saprospiraceae bacterium]MCB0542564.1 MATE family efflux transporter [Saprospiraceae bacterium]MCB9305020.1 MATE family efflux transporter [Lewinellaceae bacterium]MCB9353298.1 MATE family efflux transporter [Lewinellaceae bacterium]
MTETKTTETRLKRIGRVLRQAVNGEEQSFTTGSIDRAIVLLSIPMILEMAMESLFAVVDAFFVARIGIEAVATVGLTESVLTLVYSIAIGLSAAATAMVARRIGEGDREAAARAGAQVIVIALVMSALIAIPGYFFAEDILRMMARDQSVADIGTKFTRLMLTANLPILLLWMLNGIFRGAGDASTAMRALWISNGVNIILDPLLIFGIGPFPEMGLLGAGIATTIGRSIGVMYQLWNLFEVGKIVKIRLQYLQPQWNTIGRLLRLAAGSTGQYLIASASWIFMISILGQISKEVTAGYTIAIRIIVFTILPSWGMANAAATLVGQNLGAGHPDRAEKSAWRAAYFNMLFMAFVSIVYLLGASFFIQLFTVEPEALRAGSMALRIMAVGYVFYGYGMILSQAINGAGDTRTPTILNFIFFWLVETPLAALLALEMGWGQTGVYWSIVIAESGMAVAAMWVFRRGKWKTVKV